MHAGPWDQAATRQRPGDASPMQCCKLLLMSIIECSPRVMSWYRLRRYTAVSATGMLSSAPHEDSGYAQQRHQMGRPMLNHERLFSKLPSGVQPAVRAHFGRLDSDAPSSTGD
jgi:hypothetical protein